MSISTALGIAQRSLLNTARQTSVVSRNISEQNNPDYTRRVAVLASTTQGTRIADIQRATNDILFKQNLGALSSASGQDALLRGLDQLSAAVNGADNEGTVAAAVGRLQEAMTLYQASPSNRSLALNVVSMAKDVATRLNEAAGAIHTFRADIDRQVAKGVDDLNGYLKELETVNRAIVNGTQVKKDVNDELDRRDTLLKRIGELVPVSVIKRADNDIALMTADGITMFDTIPRNVTFTSTSVYGAGATGNRVIIDGVPLARGTTNSAPGLLGASLHLRDEVAPQQEAQLDEMARALVSAFAESDQTGGGAPARAGLFTWSGGPALPGAGLQTGLATALRINASFDVGAGGNPEFLRDGGANGVAYRANTTNAASFGAQIATYLGRLDAPFAFDPAVRLTSSDTTLAVFSSDAVGWLEGQRQSASQTLETSAALAQRTATALSNYSGVNIDEEMSLLLELEHSYQASARLIKAVDEMLSALIAAVR